MRHRLRRYRAPEGSSAVHWTRTREARANGRVLVPGTEFSVKGEPGRFRFMYLTETPSGAVWLDAIGGPKGAPAWRSFHPSRVKRVHRLTKTRENAGS